MSNAQIADQVIDELTDRIDILENGILNALISIEDGDMDKGLEILKRIYDREKTE